MNGRYRFDPDGIGELFAMTISAMSVLVLWTIFRLPGAGSPHMMAAIFFASAAYHLKRDEQLKLIGAAMGMLALFQFVLTMLEPAKILLVLTFFCGCYLLLRHFPVRVLSVAVIAMTTLTLSSGRGFETACSRGILFLLLLPAVLASAELALLCCPCRTHRTFPPQDGLDRRGARQLSMMFASGLLIWRFFQLPYGDWLIYTMVLVHMGGIFGPATTKRALGRIFLAPLGLFFAYCFCRFFVWYDYRCAYFVFFIGLAGFAASRCFGNFTLYSLIFMTYFILLYDMGFVWNRGEFSMANLMTSRLFNVGMGAFLSLLLEPDAPQNEKGAAGVFAVASAKKNRKNFSFGFDKRAKTGFIIWSEKQGSPVRPVRPLTEPGAENAGERPVRSAKRKKSDGTSRDHTKQEMHR